MKTSVWLFAALSAVAALVSATQTKTWSVEDASDFEKATRKQVSVSSDGRVTLAPRVEEIFDTASVYLWTLAEDSKGNVYAGGGGPAGPGARVYTIAANGHGKCWPNWTTSRSTRWPSTRKDQFVCGHLSGRQGLQDRS